MGFIFILISFYCIQHEEISSAGHLEVLDQSPVAQENLPSRTSSPARVDFHGFISRQVNVNQHGLNILGDAANETSIAVDPNDPNRMAIGWRQFDSISSNFRQAGWAFSTDGGQTWTFPGVLEPGIFRSDPVLSFDAQGNFYYNSLSTGYFCKVFRSSDGGQSWDEGIDAFGGDKQWMCIDRTGGPGHDNLYSAWNISYSSCEGDFAYVWAPDNQFEGCLAIPLSPFWGTMDVGPEGEVYVAGAGGVAKSSTIHNSGLSPEFDFTQPVDFWGGIYMGIWT